MNWTFSTFVYIFFGYIFIAALALKIFVRSTIGWCTSQTCLVGKTAIITGANSGIGYETALDLAKRGARVILACRDEKKANKACEQIINETGNQNVVVNILNLSSFESVRRFAKDITENEKRLDILVNNAGAATVPRKNTEDGNLSVIQVNYLSHFLLTQLLGGLLQKTPNSRVINVSSILAKFSKLDVNNLNKRCGVQTLYSNTKACNILFTRELAKRLEGMQITTYSLHPGVVSTEIWRNLQSWHKKLYEYLVSFYCKNNLEGAQTTIYLAVTKGIEKYNGEHFVDCRKVGQYKTTSDMKLAKKLWEVSENLVALKPEEKVF